MQWPCCDNRCFQEDMWTPPAAGHLSEHGLPYLGHITSAALLGRQHHLGQQGELA